MADCGRTREITSRCRAFGIDVCGTIKGCNGLPPVARALLDGGVTELASSRIEQIMRCRQAGVPGPYLLLRIPGRSELPDLVRWCDRSLQSEEFTLWALEAECARQGKEHSVILMTDLGDLREGCWDEEELVRLAVMTERELPRVHLRGSASIWAVTDPLSPRRIRCRNSSAVPVRWRRPSADRWK